MTSKTAIHSNAFNFLSFMQSSVDPRTGQYTLSVNLPELKSNALCGPDLPLRLDFNPLNMIDSGYGLGWNLNLSQYDPNDSILSLYTGETFKVTGSGEEPAIKERKLLSFRFFVDDENTCRIVHKSGLVEVLKTVGSGAQRVALPQRIYAPSGHRLDLEYTSFNGHQRLSRVSDQHGELLRVLRETSALKILTAPFEDRPGKRVLMDMNAGLVREIVLPSADLASWRLRYDTIRGITCLVEVQTPVGGRETIDYKDPGHPFPGSTPRPNLPRVSHHRLEPGFGQPPMDVDYEYSVANFLGNGSAIEYQVDGLDQLYKIDHTYVYDSTAFHQVDGVAVRSVKRVYNRFHLLIEETTQQNRFIRRTLNTYHAENVNFDQQPKQFQLPRRVETRWELADDASRWRSEALETGFDEHGNLILEIDASGIATRHTYYAVDGEEGCPADPDGFVRSLKETSVTPAPGGEGEAPVLVTGFHYEAFAPLDGMPVKPWLGNTRESLSEGGRMLSLVQREYVLTPGDASHHGRLYREIETFNGIPRVRAFTYELAPGEGVLRTVETLRAVDGTCKSTTLEHSLVLGEAVLTRDDNDVEIRYAYDDLRRVVSETVAPGTPFAASRFYSYSLTRLHGQQASQEMVDVKNVHTRTWVDGLNRAVREEREDVDGGTRAWRDIWSGQFDALGQQIGEIEYDWLGPDTLALPRSIAYDDWGQQCCVTGPDGVALHEETDPIGTPASNGPILRVWKQAAAASALRGGETVTWLNRFDKPARVERFDLAGDRVSLHEYRYDGLGRTHSETDARDLYTEYRYDVFSRLIETQLPGGAVVTRGYVEHAADDLPTHISVDGKLLGEQTFDGLLRMSSSTTGGRLRLYTYDPGQTQPSCVTTPAGKRILYEYQPQLGDEPSLRQVVGEAASEYDYDHQNARLTFCHEPGDELHRDYFSTGELKSETRTHNGQYYEMHYSYSLRGRQLTYTDVLGQLQEYHYDGFGRLHITELGSTRTELCYDDLGRLRSIDTEDQDQRVHTLIDYDEFDREVLRTFEFGQVTQYLSQTYNEVDALATRTLQEGDELLRAETYQYDARGRLYNYGCSGSHPPVDAYGQVIVNQLFLFDGLDNMTRVITQSPQATNRADYHYDNPVDPAQLTSITNNTAAYPGTILLEYDDDGNLTRDEQGRQLTYDALGRLLTVSDSAGAQAGSYRYDPLDRLASLSDAQGTGRRFYREDELASLVQGSGGTTFMRAAGNLLAERQSGLATPAEGDGGPVQ
ncbi:sugar-binding protein [Pseudomonas sp. zfem002]|uniref:sugar-binding protein n=1 Tax=Pseudomonas sp. zfem002 TaxID=3078197 RepID=UPI002927939C|nr:sugar-binding protein [Pseudomonas sp. zfem002]MDU9389393.1 sugar-binding protein [Pseudomonas sp. zfem002]